MRAILATAPPGGRRRLIGGSDCRVGGGPPLLSREGLPPRPREMSAYLGAARGCANYNRCSQRLKPGGYNLSGTRWFRARSPMISTLRYEDIKHYQTNSCIVFASTQRRVFSIFGDHTRCSRAYHTGLTGRSRRSSVPSFNPRLKPLY